MPACPYVFHRDGRPVRDFRAERAKAAKAVGREGLLFHDLKRSGARTLRRSGESEHVIMRMAGWKTPSMFGRYDIVDETDLANAADRRDAFMDREIQSGRRVVAFKKPA